MICCDTCPFSPTCEEEEDFRRDVLGWDEIANAEETGWGEDDETYAELQYENTAAADLDPYWPGYRS